MSLEIVLVAYFMPSIVSTGKECSERIWCRSGQLTKASPAATNVVCPACLMGIETIVRICTMFEFTLGYLVDSAVDITAVDIAGVVIALVNLFAFIYFSWRAWKLQNFLAKQAYASRVMDWGTEVVATMSECTTICELDPGRAGDFFDRRNHLRTRLSELIDRGRWFFENYDKVRFGLWKPGAYQGIAPNVISRIKCVHKYVEELNYREIGQNPSLRQKIVDQKRKFVSEIQVFVRPQEALEQIKSMEGKKQHS